MKDLLYIGPTVAFIDGLDETTKIKVLHELSRLKEGLMPVHYKPLQTIGSGVYEIKIITRTQIRIIYTVKLKKGIYILHAFIKKTQKTNKNDINKAIKALKIAAEYDQGDLK